MACRQLHTAVGWKRPSKNYPYCKGIPHPLFCSLFSTMARIIFSILCFLVTLPGIVNAAGGGGTQPSGVPSCFYTCPQDDKKSNLFASDSHLNGQLRCAYTVQNGSGYCYYNESDGKLNVDNDNNNCRNNAVKHCSSKRDNIVKMMQHRAEVRAAQPQISQPDFMVLRSVLGKKKRSGSNKRIPADGII